MAESEQRSLKNCRAGKDAADDLRLRIESGNESESSLSWDNALLVAAGWEPYALIDGAMAAAAKLSGFRSSSLGMKSVLEQHGETVLLLLFLVSLLWVDCLFDSS